MAAKSGGSDLASQPHNQYQAGTSKVQDCLLVLALCIIADS
jgi:hypothetical protein